MHEWKPEWEQRLARPPFKQRRFRPDMMERVERRLQSAEKKRSRKAWIQAFTVIVPALLLVLGGGIWFGSRVEPVPVPSNNGPGPVTQGGGTFRSGFEPGQGGDFDWWNSAQNAAKKDSDRTIVTLAKALLQRQLGVWGGPTPDIWENSEVKQALERYDVSSPWVYEVYVDSIRAADAQTVYSLRLGLRDSIPTVYQEMIDVYIRVDTQKISRIEQVSTDETGSPPDEGEADHGEGETVLLKEDSALDLKITGALHKEEGKVRPIRVQYGDADKTFDGWSNVSNESYYPNVAVLQAGNGDEKMLAVILTTGYGTGVHESALKLLRNDLTEVSAADPVLVAESELESSMTAEAGKRTYQFTLGGETRRFDYQEEDAGFWLDQPALGSIVRYSVEGNTLYASVPIQVSPAEFPVSIQLRYKYDGAVFTVAEAAFEDNF
ncbi:hypothetical protein EHV15_26895 [Paenibacillus oralis]|uniref:Uncharacterized protein n=1 Tax=Paenibacillus oralis TaxID=2490856 RepID=A0A3P3U756_9BACL|nr:hypothetical protein [Paenibacillus oralis]RRJ66135.1 hypothetical protein EHV15_26895 [Paenibacillus oralis]